MSPRIPLEELGSTPGEKRLLRRVGVVVSAVVVGVAGGVYAYAWADSRFDAVESRTAGVCAMSRNVYKLCLSTGTDCEPVSADCSRGTP